jgi:sulfatase maturation enzyme AslB (radical SAM superfamily)
MSTRKKLKLDDEMLRVESFAPAETPEQRGTAEGYQVYTGVYKPICQTGCPYCYLPSSDTQITSDTVLAE